MLKSLVAAASLIASPALAKECLQYGDFVTLGGQYGFAVLADGRDGADGIGDAGEHANLLFLDTPFCITSDPVSKGVSDVTSIQLRCPALQASDGNVLSLTGQLVGAHTGNGHTPVLLVCKS
jgi:hypothetical protein